MDLEGARRAVRAAEEAARRAGVPMCIAAADAAGHLLLFVRQPGALIASIDLARDKAFTAVAMRVSTHELAARAQPGRELFGIHANLGGRIVIFGGGIPVFRDGELQGGVGVSGGTVQQDRAVAEAGVRAWLVRG